MNYELSNILFVFPYFIAISKNKILISRWGTYKVRNEINENETKRNEINKNETKRNEINKNETKQNEINKNETKRNEMKTK